jgi:hypothetical protein
LISDLMDWTMIFFHFLKIQNPILINFYFDLRKFLFLK